MDFELGSFQYFANRTHATNVQRILVPWLIGLFGLSFKTAPMSVVQDMITAIIDSNCWFGPGVSCAEEANLYPLAFSDFVKKAKVAAGIFHFLLVLTLPYLNTTNTSRKKPATTSHDNTSCPRCPL
jgi:hypothetical protein